MKDKLKDITDSYDIKNKLSGCIVICDVTKTIANRKELKEEFGFTDEDLNELERLKNERAISKF
jgi:hypothetical protein